MPTFIQVTPFDNISSVAHSDEVLEFYATITINTSQIQTIQKGSISRDAVKTNGLVYTPTKIKLTEGGTVGIKVCESYDYLRAAVQDDLYQWSGHSYVEGFPSKS